MADNTNSLLLSSPLISLTGDTSSSLLDQFLGLPGSNTSGDVNLGLASVQIGAGSGSNNTTIDLLLGLNGSGGGGSGGTGGTGTGGTGGTGTGGTGTGGTGTGGAGSGSSGTGTSGAGTTGSGSGGTGGTGGTGTGGTGTGGGAVTTDVAFSNVFRVDPSSISPSVSAQLDSLQGMVDSGAITLQQALLQIVNSAAAYTSVAVTTYQFFTGLTPTKAGLDFLVNSGANPTDLNDLYYQNFNLENRYINFASNLGLHSDAAGSFAATYGGLTFDQTVRSAYQIVIGGNSSLDAGISPEAAIADIESRKPYFDAVAHERLAGENPDLAVKLVAIGYIIEEAVRANAGAYGEANQNFLYDLADGQAQFHIDLVGVYGHGTINDVV